MVKAMNKADLIIADLAENAINPKTREMYQFLKKHREAKSASQGISNSSQQDARGLVVSHSDRPDVKAQQLEQDQDKDGQQHKAGGEA